MAVVPPNYWIELKIDSIFENPGKIWRGVEGRQNCPFCNLNVGEVLFSNYANGYGSAAVPESAIELTSSESCKLILNADGRGDLRLIIATREILNQIHKNVCVKIDIHLTAVDFEHFIKSFFSTDKKEMFVETIQEYKLKKLNSDRFEKFFPKDAVKEFSTIGGLVFGERIVTNFRNVLVVLKVTLKLPMSDAKIAKIWMQNQQIAGEKLLTEGLVSDFTIQAANGKNFPCHKSYLVGSSAVLAGMMTSNMTEVNNKTLKMEDMSSDAVEGLLTYLYTGSLKNVMSNMSVIFEMLQSAHKYQIKDLEIVCNEVIQAAESQLFDAETAFELYEFCGNVTELQPLQKKAVKVLKDNGKKYGDSGELQALINSIGSSGEKQMAFAKWISESVQR